MNNTLFKSAGFYPGMSQEPVLKESALNLQFYKTMRHSIFSKDYLGKKQNTQACTKIASSLNCPLSPPLYRRCMF